MEKQETCQEVRAAMQAGDDSSLDPDGRDGGKEKWLGSGYISGIEPTRFPEGPMKHVNSVSTGIRNDLESFDLSN